MEEREWKKIERVESEEIFYLPSLKKNNTKTKQKRKKKKEKKKKKSLQRYVIMLFLSLSLSFFLSVNSPLFPFPPLDTKILLPSIVSFRNT